MRWASDEEGKATLSEKGVEKRSVREGLIIGMGKKVRKEETERAWGIVGGRSLE